MKDVIRIYLEELLGKEKIDKIYDNFTTKQLSTCVKEDLEIAGVTPKLAEKIVTVFKIRHAVMNTSNVTINQSNDAYTQVKDLAGLYHEQFDLLLLNFNNKIIKRVCHSKCGLGGTIVDVRLILLEAIRNKAAGIILAHNHPSGNPNPSKADVSITKKVRDACKMLDIKVLDHIIVAGDSKKLYTSLADEGLM